MRGMIAVIRRPTSSNSSTTVTPPSSGWWSYSKLEWAPYLLGIMAKNLWIGASKAPLAS
jgi:hypothetical protein